MNTTEKAPPRELCATPQSDPTKQFLSQILEH